jgi:hypothetical protein
MNSHQNGHNAYPNGIGHANSEQLEHLEHHETNQNTMNNHVALTTVIHEMLLNDDDKYLIKNPFMLRVNRQIRKMTVSTRETADRALLRRGQYVDKKTPEEYAQWVCSVPGYASEFSALVRLAPVEDEPRAVTTARASIFKGTLITYDEMVRDPCLVRVVRRQSPMNLQYMVQRAAACAQHALLNFVLRDHEIDFPMQAILESSATACIPVLLEYGAGPVTSKVLEKLIVEMSPDVSRFDPMVLLRNATSRDRHLIRSIEEIGRLYAWQSIDLNKLIKVLPREVSRVFADGLLSVWREDPDWMSRCFAETLASVNSITDEVRLLVELCNKPSIQINLIEYSLIHGSMNEMKNMLSIHGFLGRIKEIHVVCSDVERSWELMRHGVSVSGWKQALTHISSMPGSALVALGVPAVLMTAITDSDRTTSDVMNTVTKILKSNIRWIDPVELVTEMIDAPTILRHVCVLAMTGVQHLAASRFVLSPMTPAWIDVVREFCPLAVDNFGVDKATIDATFDSVLSTMMPDFQQNPKYNALYKLLLRVIRFRATLKFEPEFEMKKMCHSVQIPFLFAILDVHPNPKHLGKMMMTLEYRRSTDHMLAQFGSYILPGHFTKSVYTGFLEGVRSKLLSNIHVRMIDVMLSLIHY